MDSTQSHDGAIKVRTKSGIKTKARQKRYIIVLKSVMPSRYSADQREKLKEFEQNLIVRKYP